MEYFKITHSFKKLADITLKTEDGYTFETHKILLAQSSKYFETLFCGDFAQSIHTLMPTIKGKVLIEILRYIMQREDILTEENVSDILFAADYLIMEELVNNCKTFIFSGGLTVDNCVQIFNTSWIIQLKDVKCKCMRFIQIHTEKVFKKSEANIIDLQLNTFKEILACGNLNIPDESFAWNILISWIKGNISDRLVYFPELLKHIRLTEIDETLTDGIESLPEMEKCPFRLNLNKCLNFCHMIEEAKKFPLSITDNQNPRVPKRIYLICKYAQQREANLFVTYDENLDYWLFVCRIPQQFDTNCKVVCIAGQFVYFSFYDYYHPARLKAFDLLQETWKPISRVHEGLTSYTIVSVHDDMYALGGEKTSQWNVSVNEDIDSQNEDDENFNEDSFDDWNQSLEGIEENFEEVLSEETEELELDERQNEQPNNSQEELFDQENIVNPVHRYNKESDSWYRVSPMNHVHIINEIVISNKIFVIGTDIDFDKQVCQVYDTIDDSWTIIANPKYYRAYCEVVKFCDKLYLIGGKDKYHYKIRKVEEYNPAENSWRTLPDLPFTHSYPKTVVIQNKLIVYDDISIWNQVQLRRYRGPIYWDDEEELWRDATFIDKDLLAEIKLCQIIPIDNENILRELSKKQKRGRSVWTKCNLANLDRAVNF